VCFMYLCCRSDNGIVNVYDMPSCLQNKYPQPLKAFPNLTTACTCLRFNSTDEVLAVASNMQEKAVKLVLSSVTYEWFLFCMNYMPYGIF